MASPLRPKTRRAHPAPASSHRRVSTAPPLQAALYPSAFALQMHILPKKDK
ncbi:hypothetical protein ACMV_P5_00050 (plasmid) [Acidiphilium multivorum AIU301]|uniref:Uncharacterized protein n=1 Tax=Acidiphilium multivorum (strain DSM 11245 / JCM 8867 / NBRC 100883 / AIU 301) TaxID=926570 RepID=F0J842_ACIMA|nr:hypothetical protein ACMV_P5_00050 [Acidiphilium multivorum AIU301]